MTKDYALVSLRAGALAGLADTHLGKARGGFIRLLRRYRWHLSREMLVTLQSAAMTLGVPEDVIQEADSIREDPFAQRLLKVFDAD